MAEVPSIAITTASPTQSPIKDHTFGDINGRIAGARPGTPSAKGARPDSSPGWPSPGRLIKTLSSNAQATSSNGQLSRDEANGSNQQPETHPSIDPLSQHILNRTNTPLHPNTPRDSPRPRTSEGNTQKDDRSSADEHSAAPLDLEPTTKVETNDASVGGDARKDLRKGVKAVSFLSKLMGGKKQRSVEEVPMEDESTTSDERPEGNDAEVFKQSMDNMGMGYNPRHAPPPAYIKVRSRYKKAQDFDRLFLAQELSCSKRPDIMARRNSANKLRRKSGVIPNVDSTIWAMEFSRDGKYLAAAGADMVVRIWQVLGSSDDRQRHELQESNDNESNGMGAHTEHLSAPVFQSKPAREYEGAHTATILDLSWSKNNFLLSSSMDKTVRLWHVSRPECLCTFKHNDFVPSIAFHPKDDRFFLAGSLDSKLRLWSIPDKSVAFASQVPDLITAVAFTPDGKYAMAGCLTGLCMFFETEGLKYQTQIHVRSTRGQNAKGSKITGIQAFNTPTGELKILITSNDSRIRLYNFRDKSLELKFKGNENNCSQIRAMLSDDGRYVVCGSEDRKAYIWSLHQSPGERRDKTPVEMFEAHNTITTAVCMAPAKTRQYLGKSEDPIYDLCNPPPVTLLSQAEKESTTSVSRPHSRAGSMQQTPSLYSLPRESPAYVSRTAHKDGNIIVTADLTGKIKIFRQDCAWSKRIKDDADRASLFSKKGSKAGRAGSLATKNSMGSLRESRKSTSTMGPSDRILSWRQGIASTPSVTDAPSRSSTINSARSTSPSKSLEQRGRADKAPSVRHAHPLAADVMVRTPSPMKKSEEKGNGTQTTVRPDSLRAGKKQSEGNPLQLEGGRSYLFWDQQAWEEHAKRINDMHEAQRLELHAPTSNNGSTSAEDHGHLAVRSPLTRVPSYVSKLSDEFSSEGEQDHFDDAREQ